MGAQRQLIWWEQPRRNSLELIPKYSIEEAVRDDFPRAE